MRISLKWLSEYVGSLPAAEDAPQGAPTAVRDLVASADLVARRLTAVGLEVEAIERTGEGLEGVVAVRIVASEKHPNAEKLSVTRVETGRGEPLQIVCGAKNYQVGDVVPLAPVGTTLPGGAKIEKAKLRGVESSGMLCSARELGLAEDASGLLLLDRGVAPGTPIAAAARGAVAAVAPVLSAGAGAAAEDAPEGPPGGRVGSLMVGAAEGLGGRLMRTVSFLG